jgi:hypothetical protein
LLDASAVGDEKRQQGKRYRAMSRHRAAHSRKATGTLAAACALVICLDPVAGMPVRTPPKPSAAGSCANLGMAGARSVTTPLCVILSCGGLPTNRRPALLSRLGETTTLMALLAGRA